MRAKTAAGISSSIDNEEMDYGDLENICEHLEKGESNEGGNREKSGRAGK